MKLPKTDDILIHTREKDGGELDVIVRLDKDVCTCPACMGRVVAELFIRAFEERAYLGDFMGNEVGNIQDYGEQVLERAAHHVSDYSERFAEATAPGPTPETPENTPSSPRINPFDMEN